VTCPVTPPPQNGFSSWKFGNLALRFPSQILQMPKSRGESVRISKLLFYGHFLRSLPDIALDFRLGTTLE
jgi:hypothetical protein